MYLFICASCHVSTHVEVPRGVHKHDLECIMKLWQGRLHTHAKRRHTDLSFKLMKLCICVIRQCSSTHSGAIWIFGKADSIYGEISRCCETELKVTDLK